jgi:hypothetical protein
LGGVNPARERVARAGEDIASRRLKFVVLHVRIENRNDRYGASHPASRAIVAKK